MKYFSLIIILVLVLASCTKTQQPEQKPDSIIKNEVFNLINSARASARTCGSKRFPAVPKLSYNNQLAKAAQNHSIDMDSSGKLSHLSPANSQFYSQASTAIERIQQEGYRPIIIEENIAHNQTTAEKLVDDWLASPSHCASIMNSIVSETGIGHAGLYWTQDFAKPQQ